MNRDKIYITNPDEIDAVKCDCECQETSIQWYRGDEIATVCVSDNTSLTRMIRAMRNDPESYKCYYYECNRDQATGKLYNYYFEFPHRLLSFRAHSTREYTEEQKEAMRDRFISTRNKIMGVEIDDQEY